MGKKYGPTIKDDAFYERLRQEGLSKEKAARISNIGSQEAGRRGGRSKKYEKWTKQQLYEKAKWVGIVGRSKMSKSDLFYALRHH